MNSPENKMIGALVLGIGAALLIAYSSNKEPFCFGKTWSKCGIPKCMNQRKWGTLLT